MASRCLTAARGGLRTPGDFYDLRKNPKRELLRGLLSRQWMAFGGSYDEIVS